MKHEDRDRRVLYDLVAQYAEIAYSPIQNERRDLWAKHNSLNITRPPVLVSFGWWNAWFDEVFGDQAMQCQDPFYREHERTLRQMLFQHSIGDDTILEPWITQRATLIIPPEGLWGIKGADTDTVLHNHVWHFQRPIKAWADVRKLKTPHHCVDRQATERDVSLLQEAIGDLLPIDVSCGPAFQGFSADISTHVALMRGLDQLMLDMMDYPQQLHELLGYMRDCILAVQAEAEQAGDWSLTTQANQAMTYCQELERPAANSGPRRRKELWCHCASQEYTLVSPAMHDEFLLQYQLPIIEKFGLVSYGCCENLTRKITLLRKIPNLRIIAVTPVANLAKCAEQIGNDFVISWRPNPTDMVCAGFDPALIQKTIRAALEVTRGQVMHICLKDVETVQGEPSRLRRWVRFVKQTIDEYWRQE
jgi:hypothetical protein